MGYQNWRTPKAVFDLLNDEFHFTLDACASHANAKLTHYATEDGEFFDAGDGPVQLSNMDGFSPEVWRGMRVFCNPPYTADCLRRAVELANSRVAELSVLLLPPHLDAKWARDLWPEGFCWSSKEDLWTSIQFYDRISDKVYWELRLWNGRIKFGMPKRKIQVPTFIDGITLEMPDETDPETVEGPAPRAGNMVAIWLP